MKNLFKLTGLAILVMAIALLMTACPSPEGGDGGGTETPVHEHIWGSWKVTTPATCTEAGKETRTCTLDPTHYDYQTIAAIGHDWSSWTQTIAPTFITVGEEIGTCSNDTNHKEKREKALPITSTAEWNTALSQLNGKTGNYTLTIGGNIGVAGEEYYYNYPNTFGITNGSSVTLKGSGKLSLTSNGNLLCVGAGQTLVIDSASLTLEGLSTNNNPLVYVSGTLELMNGTISGNTGGGVECSGTFTMNGGTISSNTLKFAGERGGGVICSGSFTMNGGTISGNTADGAGGGVFVGMFSGAFTMNGGTISDNKGGGVLVWTAFTMNGGIISGNTVDDYGGGVLVGVNGRFRIINGTIYGMNESNAALRNTAKEEGAALDNYGTAQYGTFSGTTWNTNGSLSTTNNTIKVVNGVLK
jgi:hypothetical protein